MSAVSGIEVAPVEAWLASHVPDLDLPLEWRALVGGHSNLTYVATSRTGRRIVVRRSPLGDLQPGAHDMRREFRVLSAVWPTTVPVPQPLGCCDDEAITGSVFYVMAFVDGRPLATAADARAWIPEPGAQRRAAESYVDAVADLHLLDPDVLGIGDLSKRTDFVGRQLRAWYRSWMSSANAAEYDDRRMHKMHDLLARSAPESGALRLIHGDLGMHNCLFDDCGQLVAVLDWEVCTLGDPLFDLAYVLNRWSTDAAPVPGREAITMPAAFPSASEVTDRYAARTGSDLAGLDFFITLNLWRSACIVQGVYARYRRGQKAADGVNLDAMRATIDARVEAAEAAAATL